MGVVLACILGDALRLKSPASCFSCGGHQNATLVSLQEFRSGPDRRQRAELLGGRALRVLDA